MVIHQGSQGSTSSSSSVVWIAAVTFLVVLGVGLIAPGLPRFAHHYNLGTAEVALMLTAFAGGRLAFSLPGGVIADRIGFKPIAIIGCLITGAAAVTAATLPSFGVLIAAQVIQGLGSALYTTAALAAILADVPSTRTGRVVALYQGVVIAGMSLAPALGGLAIAWLGLSGPFIVYAASVAAGLVISVRMLPSPAGRLACEKGPSPRAPLDQSRTRLVGSMLRHPAAILALVVSFMTFWVFAGIRNAVLPVFAEETLGFSPLMIGYLLTAAALANVAVMRHAGRVIDQGRRPVIIVGSVAMAIAVAALAVAVTPVILFVVTLGIGVAKGYTGVVPITMLVDVADSRVRGAAIGFQRSATGLGLTLGPYTAGLMVDAWGYRMSFATAGVVILLLAAFGLRAPETRLGAVAREPP